MLKIISSILIYLIGNLPTLVYGGIVMLMMLQVELQIEKAEMYFVIPSICLFAFMSTFASLALMEKLNEGFLSIGNDVGMIESIFMIQSGIGLVLYILSFIKLNKTKVPA